MKINFIILLLFFPLVIQAQSDSVVRIEFQSLSRGYFEKVTVTSDSLAIQKRERGGDESITQRVVSNKEWKSLIKEMNNLTLSEIPALDSPTKKRTYDGARHSSIKIFTEKNSFEHLFDDENPNEQLTGLMKCIIQLRDK